MSRIRNLILAALALASTAVAGQAMAAPNLDCLWEVIPEAERKTYMDLYRTSGMDSFATMDISDASFEAFVTRCGVSVTAGGEAGLILGSVILAKGSEQVLLEKANVPPGALRRMWAGLPQADRQTVRLLVKGSMSGKVDPIQARAAGAIVAREAMALGLPESLAEQVFAYMFAGAIADLVEAGELV